MAYLKPAWFTTRIFNRIAMATGLSGSETLTITRRSSAQTQQIPVVAVVVNGSLPGVHPRRIAVGEEVRANPKVTLTTRGQAADYLAGEIPAERRAPVLDAYRAKLGKTVQGYESLPDVADHPVFALTPVLTGPGRTAISGTRSGLGGL